jgi:hypothetical protein
MNEGEAAEQKYQLSTAFHKFGYSSRFLPKSWFLIPAEAGIHKNILNPGLRRGECAWVFPVKTVRRLSLSLGDRLEIHLAALDTGTVLD